MPITLKHDEPTGRTTGQTEWRATGQTPATRVRGWVARRPR